MSERKSGERDPVVVERDGDVGWIRLNRPERLNAFADDMRARIDEGLARLEEDPGVRCVVITGNGRAFCTGGDVRVMEQLMARGEEAAFEALVRAGIRVVRRIDRMAKPVIAAVNGIAAGAGACLALACDVRIASDSASIGFTFSRVGLHTDWGGTYHLPRLVGPGLATELLITGGMISAERAERLGLFNRVVAASQFESATRGFAGELAAAPALIVMHTKRAVRRSLTSSLEEMLELEARAQMEAFASADAAEGITAFVEKRSPRFGRR